jgi:predicted secreted hydrolase
MAFDLTTRPVKPLVLEGPGGASRKGPADAAASLYYSFTRLKTSGTVSLEGRSFSVQGESWMDREFSTTRLTPDQVGWDWFALRLRDGRDLMLYRLRRKDGGTDFKSATLVSPEGQATYLSEKEWSVKPTASWKSRATGTVYPSRWEIEIPQAGLHLTIVPRMPDQENIGRRSADLRYWEGAVLVTGADGAEAGEGYVELTGYGANNRPPV